MFETHFSQIDAAIVIAYLIGTVLLGIYVNRHIHNSAGYLIGGRAAGTALNAATYIGTDLGLVTVMYAAAEGFQAGFAFLITPLLWSVIAILIGVSGIGVVRLRRMKLTTLSEYFEIRFGRNVRITAGVICFVAGVVNMSPFPKMGATFLTYATGYGGVEDVELIIKVITTLLVVLVLAYTILGGMVAVIVTDYIQFIVIGLGMTLGLGYCFNHPELSWESVTQGWFAVRGEAAFNPTLSQNYGWAYVLSQVFVASAAIMCWAPNTTRSLTTDSEATTRRTFLLASTGLFSRFAIPGLWGLVAYIFLTLPSGPEGLAAYFGPDAMAANPERANYGMPLLLGKLIPTGWVGFLMAGLMAAFMSTHDSYLLAFATVGSQDVIQPLLGRKLTSQESIRITRWLVLLIGITLILVGIWVSLPDEIWPYLIITGSVWLSGATTCFLGGMYWKRASSTGAMIGLIGGFVHITALFATNIQHQLASWLGHLDEAGSVEVTRVAEYVNNHTIMLASYLLVIVLFIVGSLVFPDRQPQIITEGDD